MKFKSSIIFLFIFFICTSAKIFSQAMDWETPVIKGYGKIVRAPDAAVQPDKSMQYKALFGIVTPSQKPEDVNIGLYHVARFINLLSTASINSSGYKITVVVGGPATPLVMDNANYKAKYGVDNPNTALVQTLKENGVDFYVCAQAMGDFDVKQETVDKNYTTAFSFMIVVANYAAKGYLPFMF